MNAQHSEVTSASGFELAAGGLVWRYDNDGTCRKLAVVHRAKHGDWVLPKGRPEKKETPEATALREAMEETGHRAALGEFAGSYSYIKGGRPKVVLIWHMSYQAEDYKAGPKGEIDDVVWLSMEAARERLSHESEREFVKHHCAEEEPGPSEPKWIRLRAAMHSCRWSFQDKVNRPGVKPDASWTGCVRGALAMAETCAKREDLHGAWGAVHDAQRFLVFGMSDGELVGQVTKLSAETKRKLKGWRGAAIQTLLAPFQGEDWPKAGEPLNEKQRALLRQALVDALAVLNEHSDNVYHRMDLVGRQLGFLVVVCAGLLAVGLACAYWANADPPLSLGHLAAVSLAGALGGVVSAMYQLSRVGEAKIPEALLHGVITSGRPLVGAAAALFIYLAMQSKLISIIDASQVSLTTGLVLGFVAGFSEKFVISTVAKVMGGQEDADGKGKKKDSEGEKEPAGAGGGGGDGDAGKKVPEGGPAKKKAVGKKAPKGKGGKAKG
jgi:8-oxo-dGTP diphosphatase